MDGVDREAKQSKTFVMTCCYLLCIILIVCASKPNPSKRLMVTLLLPVVDLFADVLVYYSTDCSPFSCTCLEFYKMSTSGQYCADDCLTEASAVVCNTCPPGQGEVRVGVICS